MGASGIGDTSRTLGFEIIPFSFALEVDMWEMIAFVIAAAIGTVWFVIKGEGGPDARP